MTATKLTRAAFIAALYAFLALAFPQFSYAIIQFRLSEALVLLPLLIPEAVPAIAIGCLLANLSSPFGIYDILGGTLCSTLAAWLTWRLRSRRRIAIAAPILINSFGVSLYLAYLNRELYFSIVPLIALSETVVVLGLGLPVVLGTSRALKLPFIANSSEEKAR